VLPPPPPKLGREPRFLGHPALSPVQYGKCNTLVMTESSVTAVANQYISRRKKWRSCSCAVAPKIRCKTISAVKLSQFTYLKAYVDLREGVSAMMERVRNDDTLIE